MKLNGLFEDMSGITFYSCSALTSKWSIMFYSASLSDFLFLIVAIQNKLAHMLVSAGI